MMSDTPSFNVEYVDLWLSRLLWQSVSCLLGFIIGTAVVVTVAHATDPTAWWSIVGMGVSVGTWLALDHLLQRHLIIPNPVLHLMIGMGIILAVTEAAKFQLIIAISLAVIAALVAIGRILAPFLAQN